MKTSDIREALANQCVEAAELGQVSVGSYHSNAVNQLAKNSTDTKQAQTDLGVGVFAYGRNGLGRFSDTFFGEGAQSASSQNPRREWRKP